MTTMGTSEIKNCGRTSSSLAVTEFLNRSPRNLLIGSQWLPAKSGKTFATINPTTEEELAWVAEGDKADVDEAVKAARKAFEQGPWPAMGPHQRSKYLLKIAELIDANLAALAELETLDNGMPLWESSVMISSAADTFRYYSGWVTKIYGETNPSEPSIFNYTLREPLGVCGQIIPWNGPFLLAAWKIAPAIACGNTVVLKPAEQTPLTAIRLGELILEADLPPGVVNIVTGFGVGAGSSIAAHPGIDKVAFTGSTAVGKQILQASAGNLKRITLELGGKSPNIVFADADLKEAVPASTMGFCFNAGQVCCAGTRVFVQGKIYEEFVDQLRTFTETIRVGDPFAPDTIVGPLISTEQLERVNSYFEIGKKEGGKLVLGGSARSGKGYFVDPTIFADVSNEMRLAREEIFGPVVSVIPFKDEADAIFQGNDTAYGLAAAVWTRDGARAHKIARSLKAGTVWINCFGNIDPISPFGGYKESGLGREMGKQSIDLYTEVKSVFEKL